jgi:Family of unknown function (DUF6368)
MGGPAASVLLRRPLTEADHAVGRAIVDPTRFDQSGTPFDYGMFWIADTRPIGGSYVGEGHPFGAFFGIQPDREPEDLPQIEAAYGFMPADEILLVAFCNQDADHRILGEVCAALAERFSGLVDFGGALLGRGSENWPLDLWTSDWHEVEPRFRESITGMPGQIVGIEYEPQPGRRWVTHVSDAVFARAWLKSPQFRMVK